MIDSIFFLEVSIFLIAGIVHGILGFGFPMVVTPMLSIFLSVKDAVLLTLFPTLTLNAKVASAHNSFILILKKYKLLIFFVAIGSFIGTNLLVIFYIDFYKVILSIMTLLYLNKKHLRIDLKDTIENFPILNMIFFGLCAGIGSGLVNVMVPVLIIYILELNLKKEDAIILMNSCFFTSKITQVIVFGSLGSFSLEFFYTITPLIIISLVGLYFGSKLRDKIDEHFYEKVLKVSLYILSLYLIIDYFNIYLS